MCGLNIGYIQSFSHIQVYKESCKNKILASFWLYINTSGVAVASEVESVVGDSFPGCIPNIPGQDTNPKLPFDASIGE